MSTGSNYVKENGHGLQLCKEFDKEKKTDNTRRRKAKKHVSP
jgi:hypothetical protein